MFCTEHNGSGNVFIYDLLFFWGGGGALCGQCAHKRSEPRLSTKSRFSAILCNRFLIETGLINLYPKSTLSKGYRTFKVQLMQKKTKGQGPRLTLQGRTLFNCIVNQTNMTAKQIHVATELDDLTHHLSSAADLVASIKSMSGSSAPLPSLEN